MLTRHIVPTSGNAFIANHSILNDFKLGSTHLGVVTQNNSLWELLSVQDHLKLFARLRGVPEDIVHRVVESTIDQLELRPHRHKLAGRLSGGMKRKVTHSSSSWATSLTLRQLCVAIALIGDPEVVLLDEPSAGLGELLSAYSFALTSLTVCLSVSLSLCLSPSVSLSVSCS
jgi:ABC-type multidrug transport system ATPase subunit